MSFTFETVFGINLRRRILVAVSLFAFLTATEFSSSQIFAQSSKQKNTRSTKKNLRTTQMPRLKITQLSDSTFKIALKSNGKPLLVNFWATWCDPCREEFPELVKLANEYKDRLDFVTVSMDDVAEINRGVPKFLRQMHAAQFVNYLLVAEDEDSVIRSVSKDWTGGLPFTILYEREGVAAYTRQGKIRPVVLRAEIEKVLSGIAAKQNIP